MKVKAKVAKIDQENGTMVVFTEDRQFIRLPLPAEYPKLGSTIVVSLPKEKSFLNKVAAKRWIAVAATIMLVFSIGLFGNFALSPVSAYVTLDSANSSLQIAVNNEAKVESVTALNAEGEKLLNRLSLKDKDLYLAVQEIVKQSCSSGYIDQEKENLVLASVTKVKDINISEDKIREVIYNEMYSGKYPGYVVVCNADQKQWKQANKSGRSVNRLIFAEKAKESGVTIDPKSWDNHDYLQTINDAQLSVEKMFPNSCSKVSRPADNNAGMMTNNKSISPHSQSTPANHHHNQRHNNSHYNRPMDSQSEVHEAACTH